MKTLTLCASLGLATSGVFAAQPEQLTGNLVKGSEVIGADLFAKGGENIGEINDFMFDENKGAIAYGILAIGGWLGIGEELVVVPWKYIAQSEGDEEGFVVNLDKVKLKAAEHFALNAWPAFDNVLSEKVFTYYGLKGEQFKGVKLVRGSEAIGADLNDKEGADIGDINDLLLHPNSGKVAYGVLEIGEWAGFGDDLVIVPWSLIRQSKSVSEGYVLNLDKAKFLKDSFFDRTAWPDYNDPAWNVEVYHFYSVPYYWVTPVVY